eukprot:6195115-Pleurochrysis_carterae.AAC.1
MTKGKERGERARARAKERGRDCVCERESERFGRLPSTKGVDEVSRTACVLQKRASERASERGTKSESEA